jgi:hypothetical protein
VLVLTLDGTKDCVFLIEDQNRQSFAPKTLAQLQNHFEEKERKVLEAEQQLQWRLEQEKMDAFMKAEQARRAEEAKREKLAAQRKVQEEARRRAEREEQRKKEELLLRGRAFSIVNGLQTPWDYQLTGEIVIIITLVIVTLQLLFSKESEPLYIILSSLGIIVFVCLYIYTRKVGQRKVKEKIADYIKKNPNDPVNKYLKTYNR